MKEKEKKIHAYELMKKDDEIVVKFNQLTDEFHNDLNGRKLAINQMISLS